MKNVSKQWKSVENYKDHNITVTEVFDQINKSRNSTNVTVPSENDLHMSRVSLAYLQNLYKLDINDVVAGKIAGTKSLVKPLDADDCLQIGIIFLDSENYNNSVMWFEEALNKLADETENPSTNQIDIWKHYSFALLKQGHREKAKNLLFNFFELVNNSEHFYKHIRSFNTTQINDTLKEMYASQPLKFLSKACNCYDDYESLCKGNTNSLQPRYRNSSFVCFYKQDRPFLKLAPIKVELLSIKPKIYSYKNVLSDGEINLIKKLAEPKLTRGRILNYNKSSTSQHRTANVAWMFDGGDKFFTVLNKRIEHMTNLNLQHAEQLQIANYGLGGHYDLHLDAFGTGSERNDRIATVLFYLSTPEAGGATVFPLADVVAFPKKNDAIMWYSLFRNGTRDFLSLHSGCPVLLGNKWIANKWIREKGQEFMRKCDLNKKK